MAKDINDFFNEIDKRVKELEDNPFYKKTPERLKKIADIKNKSLRTRSRVLGKKAFGIVPDAAEKVAASAPTGVLSEAAPKVAPKVAKKAAKGLFSSPAMKTALKIGGGGLVGGALSALLSEKADAGVESRMQDDIIESLPGIGQFMGRLEGEPSDPAEVARRAIEDPSSPEGQDMVKRLAAAGLITSGVATGGALAKRKAGKKAVEGIIDDPVGKARAIKKPKSVPVDADFRDVTGGRDVVKTGSKRGAKSGGDVFQQLIDENAGLTGDIKDELAEEATENVGKQLTKEVAEEGVEEGAKKGGMFAKGAKATGGFAKGIVKKHPILSLIAGGIALNSIFGEGKKPKQILKPLTMGGGAVKQAPDETAERIKKRFEDFRKELDRDLEALQ